MCQVYLFLAQGFEEIEALTVVDLLRRAGISITTVSISDSLQVNGAHNIPVTADALFSNLDFLGMFIRLETIKALVPLIVLVVNFGLVYRTIMWIIGKIPMINIR